MKNTGVKNSIILDNCHIDETVSLGENVKIFQNVTIIGNCEIGDNVTIYPNTIIEDCKIDSGTVVKSSYLEKSIIGKDCIIGPYAHLRPNSCLKDECHIGNFVEIKNSTIGKGTKANHLAYVGDADIGENCNIGCGAIFVNYNGKEKNRTKVGNNCFIGSNCNIVAPVEIANNSYICAGTTLTVNTKEFDFVIGRSKETIKSERAKKYLKNF